MICDGIKRYYTMSKRQNDDDAQHSSAITSAEEKFTVPIGWTLLVLTSSESKYVYKLPLDKSFDLFLEMNEQVERRKEQINDKKVLGGRKKRR